MVLVCHMYLKHTDNLDSINFQVPSNVKNVAMTIYMHIHKLLPRFQLFH